MQRMWRSLPLAALALALLAGPGRSQEAKTGPLERKALDLALYNNLRDVINRGADLYNSGDWAACYRLYEGSLMVVKPLLDHRPALQKAIAEHITSAERNPLLYQRAFVLREVIDQIRDEVNPNPKPKTKPEQTPPVAKTLWDRLGGEKGVTKIVNDLVNTVSKDPAVDWTRGGKVKITPELLAKMKKDLVEQISSWTGGPLKYNGPDMKEVHKKMGITNPQYDAFEADLKEVLELNGVAKADINAILKDVDSYRKQIVQAKVEPKPEEKTLWARLGGDKGVTKIIDDLVDVASKDPKVDFFRGGKFKLDAKGVDRLKKEMIAQVSSLTGGPTKYEGLNMKEAHKGMGITDAQFDAFMDDVKKVLADNKVADADARTLIAAYNSYRTDTVAPAKKPEEKKPPEKKPEEKKPPEKKPEEKKPEEKKPLDSASLTGHVAYKGKPLPGGVLTLHGEGGKTYAAPLGKDGTYSVKAVPPGEYKITVSTEALKPATLGVIPKAGETGVPKAPEAKGGPEFVSIPAKYGDPKTTPLAFTAAKGAQVHDLELD